MVPEAWAVLHLQLLRVERGGWDSTRLVVRLSLEKWSGSTSLFIALLRCKLEHVTRFCRSRAIVRVARVEGLGKSEGPVVPEPPGGAVPPAASWGVGVRGWDLACRSWAVAKGGRILWGQTLLTEWGILGK